MSCATPTMGAMQYKIIFYCPLFWALKKWELNVWVLKPRNWQPLYCVFILLQNTRLQSFNNILPSYFFLSHITMLITLYQYDFTVPLCKQVTWCLNYIWLDEQDLLLILAPSWMIIVRRVLEWYLAPGGTYRKLINCSGLTWINFWFELHTTLQIIQQKEDRRSSCMQK